MSKDKILIIEDSLQSNFGGGQVVTNKIIDLFKDKIILFDTKKNHKFKVKTEKVLLRPSPVTGRHQSLNLNGRFVFILPLMLLYNNLHLLFFCFRYRLKIKCIYAPTKLGLTACCITRIFLKIPIIFHAHNVYDERIVSKVFLYFVNLLAHNTICVSETVSSSMPNVENKVLIYNWMQAGSYPIVQKQSSSEQKQVFAVVANFLPYKGHDLVLQAFSQLEAPVLNRLELRFYGGGALEHNLRQKSQILGLDVRFMGFIDLMEEEYAHIDYIIVPSLMPEAFSLVIGEAWHNNTIVLASNLGAHAELLDDNITGHLFDAGEVPSLCKKLILLLNSTDASKKSMIDRSKVEAAKYSIDLFKEKMTDVLEGIQR